MTVVLNIWPLAKSSTVVIEVPYFVQEGEIAASKPSDLERAFL